jgi:hypothetical protein
VISSSDAGQRDVHEHNLRCVDVPLPLGYGDVVAIEAIIEEVLVAMEHTKRRPGYWLTRL